MRRGTPITFYLDKDQLARLDLLRRNTKRSIALNRTLAYILSQPDYWVQDLICVPEQTS